MPVAGLRVESGAQSGVPTQHRSRAARESTQPNLRQVHLAHAELSAELQARDLAVSPGQVGENHAPRRIERLALPACTELHIGRTAVVRLARPRNSYR